MTFETRFRRRGLPAAFALVALFGVLAATPLFAQPGHGRGGHHGCCRYRYHNRHHNRSASGAGPCKQ